MTASGGELLDRLDRARRRPRARRPRRSRPSPPRSRPCSAPISRATTPSSYRLLTDASRKKVGDEADWADLRSELPPITGFEVAAGDEDDEVVATVTHEPGLDPFVGLSPAEERQTWRGVAGRRRLAGRRRARRSSRSSRPTPTRQRPPAAGPRRSRTATRRSPASARRVDEVLRHQLGRRRSCADPPARSRSGRSVRSRAGRPRPSSSRSTPTPPSAWARVVPVEGPTEPFLVVLAPIGDEWRVVGVSD